MMFRTTDIVLIAVMMAAAAFTYKTKHDAESKLAEIKQIQDRIQQENDTIDVLKADWSLLTQPARLQRLAEIYHSELDLEQEVVREAAQEQPGVQPPADQIVEIDELPTVPVDLDGLVSKKLGGMADTDSATTGSIVQ